VNTAACVPSGPFAAKHSVSQVNLGDSVMVSWTGAQSHPNDWQDWDWIAGFIPGACTATGVVGEDTCYAVNQWAWVSDQGGSSSGSWNFSFNSPGTYEFRVSYCGCDECNDITGDFAACDRWVSCFRFLSPNAGRDLALTVLFPS
jgi:hypothetical protein